MILRQILALAQFFYDLIERVARPACVQHIDFRPFIYLAVDEFQPGELSFSLPVRPWRCDCGPGGGFVFD
jgi:hypothetical protein